MLAAGYQEKARELIGFRVVRADRVQGNSSSSGLGNVAGSRVSRKGVRAARAHRAQGLSSGEGLGSFKLVWFRERCWQQGIRKNRAN